MLGWAVGRLWASNLSSTAWSAYSALPKASHREEKNVYMDAQCPTAWALQSMPGSAREETTGTGWLLAALWGKGGLSGILACRTSMELNYCDITCCVEPSPSFPDGPAWLSKAP